MVDRQQGKHGRLAAALVVGPALTLGILGTGLAPATAAPDSQQQIGSHGAYAIGMDAQADQYNFDELELLDLAVDPTDVPEGSNPHVTTQATPIIDLDGNAVGYVEEGTILAIVATDAVFPAAPIADSGPLGAEELYVPDYDLYLTPWEAPSDEGEDPVEAEEEQPVVPEDEEQPAVPEDEELAETGVDSQQLGLLAGLFTAMGLGLIAFANRSRLTHLVGRSRG